MNRGGSTPADRADLLFNLADASAGENFELQIKPPRFAGSKRHDTRVLLLVGAFVRIVCSGLQPGDISVGGRLQAFPLRKTGKLTGIVAQANAALFANSQKDVRPPISRRAAIRKKCTYSANPGSAGLYES